MKTKFKITGPGEYRTRDGRKAVVLHRLRGQRDRPWQGYVCVQGHHDARLWGANGEHIFEAVQLVRRVK